MCRMQEELSEDAVPVALPDPENESVAALDEANYRQFVAKASIAHLKRVRSRKTFAVLVANFDKHGIEDYIGPSTFAEIAAAASHGKRIFVLNDFPVAYRDLLSAWNAVPLHGKLDCLVESYRQAWSAKSPDLQLDLHV
jgi:hypothetical protein